MGIEAGWAAGGVAVGANVIPGGEGAALATATVGPGLANNEAASDGLGLPDGPAVHALRTSAMAITSRPKRRLTPDSVEARLGAGLGDAPRIVMGDQCDRRGRRALTRQPKPPALIPNQSGCFNIGDIGSRLPL